MDDATTSSSRAANGAPGARKPRLRAYLATFAALTALTVIEVALTRPELHVARTSMTIALIGLALTKAALVAFHFMHLHDERPALKRMVLAPMAAPALYALVLITEAAWRLRR